MKYEKGFDTLRAFCCLFVIIAHWGVWFDNTTSPGRFIQLVVFPDGGTCVSIFFVLSVFLVTSILLIVKDANAGTNKMSAIGSFLARRALRIYPLYYLLLFFLFAINFPDVREHIASFATFTSNFLIYYSGIWNQFCVTWTLSIEEQFYLLLPFIILFVNSKYLGWVFTAALMIGVATTYITMAVQRHLAPCLLYNCFDAFAIGGLYAWVRHRDRYVPQFENGVKIAALLCLVVYFYCRYFIFLGYPGPFFFLWKTIDSVIAVWLLALILNNRSVWVKKYLLENRYLNFIGRISYGLYLLHDVYANGFMSSVNGMLNKATRFHPHLNGIVMNPYHRYWIHMAIVFTIATCLHVLVEQPFLKLKKFTFKPAFPLNRKSLSQSPTPQRRT